MLAALHLAASLCSGFPIVYVPDWNLSPDVTATPTAPMPEYALLHSDTVRFVTRYESDPVGDTAFLGWDPVRKDLVEERASAKPNWLTGHDASRTALHGVDPDANRKGLALARSDSSWLHDSTGWYLGMHMSHMDSSGIDIYMIRRKPYLNDNWYTIRIRQAKHSSGYIAWRDSSILSDTGWIRMGRDEFERNPDGAPRTTRTWINQGHTEPILAYTNNLTWNGKLLVRMESHLGDGSDPSLGMFRANFAWDAAGRLDSREDSGEGYTKVTRWIRDAAGNVVERAATETRSFSFLDEFESVQSGRILYTYDSDNRLVRSDAFLKLSDTAAWYQESRQTYTYDAKGRVTSTRNSSYCRNFDSDSCRYYTTHVTYLDAPWRVGVRGSDGSRASRWRSSIQNGSFVLDAGDATSASLEIFRLDGTRLVAQKGKGRLATVDLRQWKGSPLLWRARIDGVAVSGSILLP